MTRAVHSLTDEQRGGIDASLEGWHQVRRTRIHHRSVEIMLSCRLSDAGVAAIRPQIEAQLRLVRVRAKALDAAYVLYEKDGPKRVLDEARRFSYAESVLTDHEYLRPILARTKEEELSFDDLDEETRLRLAAMTEIPVRLSSSEADIAKLWSRAQGVARRILDGEAVQSVLHTKGPAKAADEALGALKGRNATDVRRMRLGAKGA
jgi:hypothetical protein